MVRGYCAKCKEYRSDDTIDVWCIVWQNGVATCERCDSEIDVMANEEENNSPE